MSLYLLEAKGHFIRYQSLGFQQRSKFFQGCGNTHTHRLITHPLLVGNLLKSIAKENVLNQTSFLRLCQLIQQMGQVGHLQKE